MRQVKFNETAVKSQVKDFLALKGIFSFPLTQGLGTYRGAPDRCMHYRGRVIYLEVKLPTGKLSEWQQRFQEICQADKIDYWVIRSLEELEEKIEAMEVPDG